ncbi:MAG TPA: aminotransferase class I/II-fold pyridoxal phosphate-dependent enzyme [Nitrososphaeraceae archaeon]|nr:aminotransferase class I/II-fold pyridoxal phosphate-dependent enzyme [Nitrososphaeraceae archaeon]
MEEDEINRLRSEIRDITEKIMYEVHNRMQISKRIGEIKSKLNVDVTDEKVEQDIRKSISKLAKEIGMDTEFSGKLLSIILTESVKLQQRQQYGSSQRQTHLGIFMKAKQLEATGKKVIHMEVGEPDYPPPNNVKSALIKSYESSHYHYTDTKGILKLRQAVANKVQNNTKEDQVIITAGARFAVFSAFVSLLRIGDEIISIEPAWPAYRECADFVGVKTNLLKTTLEQEWNPDVQTLGNMINTSTKMIVINYPNNPTGKVLEDKILEKIVSLAKDNNMYLLSDEVYSDYAFTGFKSVLEYGYDKSIMISSFSKGYAMTGFRVGYAIANTDIVDKIAKVQATALTSVAEPMQYCALTALEGNDPSKNKKIMKKRLDLVCNRLRKISFSFFEPEGGMYVYPKFKNEVLDDDVTIVERLLDLGVAVAPGSGFGDSYRRFIRISGCQSENVLQQGLDRIEAAVY